MRQRTRTMLGPVKAVGLDSAAWIAGILAAVWTRYDFALTASDVRDAVAIAMLAVLFQAVFGHTRFLYRGRHGSGTFEEVRAVSATVAVTAGVVLVADLSYPVRLVPASAPLVGGVLALVIMLAGRYVYRLRRELGLRPDRREGVPALLFGAGMAGHDLVRALLRNRRSAYAPVGLLDDDPEKRHLLIHGVPVLGSRRDIPTAVARTGATTVIFCIGDADPELIGDVQRISIGAGAGFKVVPPIRELLEGRAGLADLADVEISNLLCRRQIETDLAPVAGYLAGKRVLVTGAGGSIGSELCRQIQRFEPGELMMLDRDESALHAVQLSLRGRALLDSAEVVLADLRDQNAMRKVFARRKPHVVFHAAALKHLPLLERHPGEAVKTNVWGTQTLLELARDAERFVNISTDKAANPISVLGYSKRITERLTAYAATRNAGVFLNVRFGNVLGSRGSVLTAFTAQAAAGGPITVTHPNVTRYFMTIQEAVQLVIHAAAIGRDGEALVLDMGEPIPIAELARRIARRAPQPIKIVYTGLRAGEKLHEELFAEGEADRRPLHPLISHVRVPPLHPSFTELLDPYADPTQVITDLATLCRTPPDETGGIDGRVPNLVGVARDEPMSIGVGPLAGPVQAPGHDPQRR